MSRIRQIIDAVVADLAAKDFGRPMLVEARKLPRYKLRAAKDSKLPSLEKLCVYVSPANRTPEWIARNVLQKDFGLTVGFMQVLPTVDLEGGNGTWDDDELNRLIDLVEDVEDYLSSNVRISSLATARYFDAKTDPVFDLELLQTRHVFASIIELVVRQAPVK